MKSIIDPRPRLRQHIQEDLWLAANHVDNACRFVDIGDDDGLAHCVRKVVGYVNEIARSTRQVITLNAEEEADREGGGGGSP